MASNARPLVMYHCLVCLESETRAEQGAPVARNSAAQASAVENCPPSATHLRHLLLPQCQIVRRLCSLAVRLA